MRPLMVVLRPLWEALRSFFSIWINPRKYPEHRRKGDFDSTKASRVFLYLLNISLKLIPAFVLIGGVLEYRFLVASGLEAVFPLIKPDTATLFNWFIAGATALVLIGLVFVSPLFVSYSAESDARGRFGIGRVPARVSFVFEYLLGWLPASLIFPLSKYGYENWGWLCLALLILATYFHGRRVRSYWHSLSYVVTYVLMFFVSVIIWFVANAGSEEVVAGGMAKNISALFAYALVALVYWVVIYLLFWETSQTRRRNLMLGVGVYLMPIGILLFPLDMSDNVVANLGTELGFKIKKPGLYNVPEEVLGLLSQSQFELVSEHWIRPDVAFSIGGVDVLCFNRDFSGHREEVDPQNCLVIRESMPMRWVVRDIKKQEKEAIKREQKKKHDLPT